MDNFDKDFINRQDAVFTRPKMIVGFMTWFWHTHIKLNNFRKSNWDKRIP